ncbi:TetR/AcrR family transcriptional regulator [Mycolicibacterium fluoranthenivorans]|uniref:TetR/AcrR family transcriptional regulator n=1 Tax=Mycolicibacterium fluoranthenivorans TaxID=258505 RepID=A0A7G8P9H5_9MYCO|nr:TetR/AcrR family transcriptional regulator [Mycolicibacterium fluoranthenivorans]QNJ90975.1 TetR/AcrR family transcriptional regulator [Mycolicibacterium fluoranthenivorans]QNJ90991.1 TetR/AcrR family transcriptional regulator [Mycolicibacterium fluoranthenivorans]QNJ94831.1 TetR/AcrR family transcriptional regulator [Mycolicibacterium fluoranthenivorans]
MPIRSGRGGATRSQPTDAPEPAAVLRKPPITAKRITAAALQVVATQGYDALTIRSVTNVLHTGPSSLYAHISTKTDLDDLLIGHLCSRLELPTPDPARWREQIRQVCVQLRDQYLAYPGISRAALAMTPGNPDIARVSEAMFSILLAGGIAPQTAAWSIDALALYIAGYALERSLIRQQQKDPDATWVLSQTDLVGRLHALPETDFPNTHRYSTELTSGVEHERFDFTIGLIIDNLSFDASRARSNRDLR